MGRKIAISNKKGGIGKTTTAIEISSALAKLKKKVLLVDLDPQGHASIGLSIEAKDNLTVANLLKNSEITCEEVIQPTYIDNLHLIPSNRSLEMTMKLIEASDGAAFFRLRNKLKKAENKYDYIIIDCPPAINTLTISAMVFADEVIMPIKLGRFEEEGSLDFIDAINEINETINKNIDHKVFFSGVLVTFYNPRARLSKKKLQSLEDVFEGMIFDSKIPTNVTLMEAVDEGISVQDLEPSSKGAEAYMKLAKELIAQDNKKKKEGVLTKEVVNNV